MIVSGLGKKVNLRVSFHDAISNCMLIKKQTYETNYACLTRFKSLVGTLKIAGGENFLVSSAMLKTKIRCNKKRDKR